MAKWLRIIDKLKEVRNSTRGGPPAIYREATQDLAAALLDHLSGYFAVVASLRPVSPSMPLDDEDAKRLALVEEIVRELQDMGDPDAPLLRLALRHFQFYFRRQHHALHG
jgi:hypothetical protein